MSHTSEVEINNFVLHSKLRMREAILVIGGAFNPIHTQHVALLCLAKEELEATGQWKILGGYCAVAPDNYVRHKLQSRGEPTIQLQHRLALVGLAMAEIPWLRDSPYQSEMLKQHDGSASALGQRLRRLMKNDTIESLIVMGADRMVKKGVPIWRRATTKHVGIGRKTDEKIDLHALWEEDLKNNRIVQPNDIILLEKSARPVSSSLIRINLHQWMMAKGNSMERESIEEDLVMKNCYLSHQVMEYIKVHENDLYIEKST